MAETGRSSGTVKNPNANPARNIPRIPQIPRDRTRVTANGGNVGKGGKDIPVNDVGSSNVTRTTPGWSGRYERSPRL
jgi:hypothetical protein